MPSMPGHADVHEHGVGQAPLADATACAPSPAVPSTCMSASRDRSTFRLRETSGSSSTTRTFTHRPPRSVVPRLAPAAARRRDGSRIAVSVATLPPTALARCAEAAQAQAVPGRAPATVHRRHGAVRWPARWAVQRPARGIVHAEAHDVRPDVERDVDPPRRAVARRVRQRFLQAGLEHPPGVDRHRGRVAVHREGDRAGRESRQISSRSRPATAASGEHAAHRAPEDLHAVRRPAARPRRAGRPPAGRPRREPVGCLEGEPRGRDLVAGVVVQVARDARPLGDLRHARDRGRWRRAAPPSGSRARSAPADPVRLAAGSGQLAAPEMDRQPRERSNAMSGGGRQDHARRRRTTTREGVRGAPRPRQASKTGVRPRMPAPGQKRQRRGAGRLVHQGRPRRQGESPPRETQDEKEKHQDEADWRARPAIQNPQRRISASSRDRQRGAARGGRVSAAASSG